MAKVKTSRKSTWVDMTAMTDVAFLLLTFFMLATQFRPEEAVIVDTPSSTSNIQLPENKIIQITIDHNGRIFFGMQGKNERRTLLKRIASLRNLSFSEKDYENFSLVESFGVPISELKQYLAMDGDQRKKYNETTKGIPCDSIISVKNELSVWVIEARKAYQNQAIIAIKGDNNVQMPVIKDVINTLQKQRADRFNFITTLEKAPE